MAQFEFDLVVLGGGSAGYAAAIRAVELGSTVALIEKDKVGGTCLHRGCVPTKALLHAAEVADEVKESHKFGINVEFNGVDIDAVSSFRSGIVASKYKGLQGLLKARGITVVDGFGKLTSSTTVAVGDDTYVGKHVVLATGSFSKTLPGLELGGRIITSEQALELDHIPERVAILGGGVIGVEFASVWNSFGADVTIIEGFPHLIPNEEASISKYLERTFKRRGIKFNLNVRFKSVTQDDNGVDITLENGDTVHADLLLVAVGRGPVTDGIGLEDVGVATDRGFVTTDEHLETNVPGVFAVGDIVPGLQLAHRGFQQGIYVAEHIAGLNPVPVADINIPKITYCDPEVMSVGYSEQKAQAAFGDDAIATVEYNLAGNAKSSILNTGGFIKIVRKKDGPIIGVHGVGRRMGELVVEGQLIVNWEAYPDDVAALVHAHPTQYEAIGEAAMALAGKPLHSM